MINLNVPYLNDAYIASVAGSFLKQNQLISIPINIEYVIDPKLRIDIVPTPGLQDLADTDGYCSSDCTANVSVFGDQTKVRANFRVKFMNNRGGVEFVGQVDEPKFYQDFFTKLDKGIFIEKEKI